MKIRVLEKFHDLKVGVIREEGEIFEDTESRFKEINKLSKENYGKMFVERIEEISTEETADGKTTTEKNTEGETVADESSADEGSKKRTRKKRS